MGPICAQPLEKDDNTETADTLRKPLIQFQGVLAQKISVELVLNSYRQCRGESLLVIAQSKNLQHCDPLTDYTNDSHQTMELVHNMRKTFIRPIVSKNCPYKKLLLCIMPNYRSQDAQAYKQLFVNVLREALEGVKEVSVEFMHTIDGVHTLPNQILLSLMLSSLISAKAMLKLKLLTTQKKFMNFYRYELMKTQRFIPHQAKF